MALIVAGQRNLDMRVERVTNTTTIQGDKQICESAIKQGAQFALDHGATDSGLRNLTISPLSLSEVRKGMKLVEDFPFLLVVPNEINKNSDTDGILIARKITLGLNDTRLVGLVGEAGVRAMRLSKRSEIELLGISTQAWEATGRHLNGLEDEERKRAQAEAERKRAQAEAERKRAQAEAERKRAQEEAERKRAQEEAERKRAQAEAERKRVQAETERKRAQAEAERRRAQAEAEESARKSAEMAEYRRQAILVEQRLRGSVVERVGRVEPSAVEERLRIAEANAKEERARTDRMIAEAERIRNEASAEFAQARQIQADARVLLQQLQLERDRDSAACKCMCTIS